MDADRYDRIGGLIWRLVERHQQRPDAAWIRRIRRLRAVQHREREAVLA